MPQPTPYTQATDFSQDEANNVAGRSTVDTSALDAEFSAISATIGETLSNLAMIQRDDGALADTSVTVATLSRSVLNLIGGFTVRGEWAAATAYAVNDIVSEAGILYLCQTAHTSPGAFVEAPNWTHFGFAGSENAATTLAASGGSALVGVIQSGTGALPRTVQDELREVIKATQYSTIANAIAVASGKLLRLPAGTFNLTFGGSVGLTPPLGTVIAGDGMHNTVLNLTPPNSASYPIGFDLSAGKIVMRGLTINYLTPAGGTGILIRPGSDLAFDDVKFDGTCTNVGASISHENHCIGVPSSGTANDVEFINCDFTRWRFTILKAIASTCSNRRWSFFHCDSYGSYDEDFSFNSPNGIWDDIQVYMCRFRDSAGASASRSPIYVAFASCTNFRVGACSFTGDVGTLGHAIHIEENSIGGTITGNSINVDGYGIELNGNNLVSGGAITFPSHVVISNNTIRKAGVQKEAGFRGVAFVFNASAHKPSQDIVLSNNSIIGYEDGIYAMSMFDDGIVVRGNYVESCTNGINFSEGSMSISGNTTANCDVGIVAKSNNISGVDCSTVEAHTFINCTVNVDSTELPVTLLDPKFVFSEFDHAGGSTSVYKAIIPAGANDRVHGFLEIVADCDNSLSYSRVRDDVTWDGTTFNRTNKIAIQPGAINALAANNSGSLSVQVFASSSRTNVRVQARLNGMAVISV